MLNVPSQSFPAPSSQQRAASGGRSKGLFIMSARIWNIILVEKMNS
ncbi:Cytochrome b5 reductase 4 [Vulpes lagopus]